MCRIPNNNWPLADHISREVRLGGRVVNFQVLAGAFHAAQGVTLITRRPGMGEMAMALTTAWLPETCCTVC